MAEPEFRSPAEFREVMDRVFTMMSEDPDMGPALRDADVEIAAYVRDHYDALAQEVAEDGESAATAVSMSSSSVPGCRSHRELPSDVAAVEMTASSLWAKWSTTSATDQPSHNDGRRQSSSLSPSIRPASSACCSASASRTSPPVI